MKQLFSGVRAVAILGALVVVAAVPALAVGSQRSNHHGNKCGHVRHTKAVGKTCTKHTHKAKRSRAAIHREAVAEHEAVSTETCETDQAGGDQNEQAGDRNDQADNENEQADGENEQADDQNEQADGENDQCGSQQDD